MIITLSPQRRDVPLTLSVAGAVLTLNGAPVDLRTYDAAAAPHELIVGQPVEEGGQWRVTLVLPHGGAAPAGTLYPAQIDIAEDGPVDLPPFDDAGQV